MKNFVYGLILLLFPAVALAHGNSTGMATFISLLLFFLLINLAISLAAAALEASGHRLKTFSIVFAIWFFGCIIISWGPPLVEVIITAMRGENWGSYTKPYPGHIAQYAQYIARNRLIPFPSFIVSCISACVTFAFVVLRRLRRNMGANSAP